MRHRLGLLAFALLASAACGTTPAPPGADGSVDVAAVDRAIEAAVVVDVVADATVVTEDASADVAEDVASADACEARWVCDGMNRSRCVSGSVESARCEFGCVDNAAGDATCSCGPNAGFTVWNCLADGDLHRCSGGNYLSQSCMGAGCVSMPSGVDDVCRTSTGSGALQAAVDRLAGACPSGVRCGIAVRELMTMERAHANGDDRFQSASSAKAMWVAAAILDRGVGPVEPLATPVFRDSDNDASGRVIDLLSSPNRVNTFYQNEAGMTRSSLCRWNTGGRTRQPSNCVAWSGASNYFTANDATEFLSRLWSGRILTGAQRDTMLSYMTRSPRAGSPGGALGTQLPASARGSMHHKAGWIPDLGNQNDIGIVEYAPGRAYAVSLLTTGTSGTYARQGPWIEYASCVLFHAAARDVGDPFAPCRR